MKGITHFLVGVAVATCFATAIEACLMEKSLIILLGGIFGILPDTLDFRFARYLIKHDYQVHPGTKKLDPHRITKTLIRAIEEANTTGKTVKVKLHTLKLAADLWRRYSVRIDPIRKEVTTIIGPIVTTGQAPIPGSAPPKEEAVAKGKFKAEVEYTYEEETYVDIFSGPDFAFVKDGDRVRIDFIPWHRQLAHSFTLGVALAPIGFIIYGWTQLGLTASAIILFAFWSHIITDQVGVLGSNLFYPFTKKRTTGMGLFHASDPVPNFFTNYCAVAVVVWNVNQYAFEPVFTMPIYLYILYVVIIPLGTFYGLIRIYRSHKLRVLKRLAVQGVEEAQLELYEIAKRRKVGVSKEEEMITEISDLVTEQLDSKLILKRRST